jgi:hypothetical protein
VSEHSNVSDCRRSGFVEETEEPESIGVRVLDSNGAKIVPFAANIALEASDAQDIRNPIFRSCLPPSLRFNFAWTKHIASMVDEH